MGNRRQAREAAVQFLYQFDLTGGPFNPKMLADFWKLAGLEEKGSTEFSEGLILGVVEKMPELDAKIATLAENWNFERLAVVDRNILRLALYEMLFRPEIPPVVSINEAIDIAKKFGSEESGKFVNGLLDRAKKDLPRPARQPSGVEPGRSKR